MIIHDMEGLTYDSYNKIVKITSNPGRDFLFISPTEQVITIYKIGFEPLKIILNEVGIKLESGKVWQIKVTGDKKIGLISIIVNATPSDADIYIDSKKYLSGNAIQVSEGEHEIKIEKPTYLSKIEKINVSPKNILFTYNLQVLPRRFVTIKTIPTNAKVYVNKIEKGESDFDFIEYLGKYEIRIIKPGYLERIDTINVVEKSDNIFSYQLIKNSGIISFSVDPSDASIYVNGEILNSKELEAKPGEFEVEVSKKGYYSKNEKIILRQGEKIQKNYKLEKNTSSLLLSVIPTDSKIFIDKEDYSLKNIIELAPGKHLIEIKKDGYTDVNDFIEIELNKPVSRYYTLIQKLGSFILTVKPIGASVQIEREGKIFKSGKGSQIFEGLPIGEYNLIVKAEGYKSEMKNILIEENKTVEMNSTLAVGSDGPEGMIFVEGGEYLMGSENGDDDEKPVHKVMVNSFYIDKYEVTQREYEKVMGNNPSSLKNPDAPVTNVDWNAAIAYAIRVNKRLPTEAEWEYAARGGKYSKGYLYSGSKIIGDIAWYADNSGKTIHAVGAKQPNELGIFDMSGNVSEWCSDWYATYQYISQTNPMGPSYGEYRIYRGGSCLSLAFSCRISYRKLNNPNYTSPFLGFRCVMNGN
jgi:formylglycine-generating enzyme required for sulfatase activity